jgi:hypothetical protein
LGTKHLEGKWQILKRSSLRYSSPMNTLFLEIINLSLLRTSLKPFFLNNDPNIKFILVSTTWSMFLRVNSFLKVTFIKVPTPSILEVDEFLISKCSLSISLWVKNILF